MLRRSAVGFVAVAGRVATAQWTHVGGDAARTGAALMTEPLLAGAAWVCGVDQQGNAITFVGQSGVVVSKDLALAVGRVRPAGATADQYELFAVRRRDGIVAWGTPVAAPYVESYSGPAVDERNGVAVIGAGRFVMAARLSDGSVAWRTQLARNVVNASPLVTAGAVPVEPGRANRVFITDYDGFGGAGSLYCINADPFDSAANPFAPGQIVWSVPIGGSSGNPAAMLDGVVYVAAIGDGTGVARAYPAGAVSAPAPLWERANPAGEGFFGGVCARRDPLASDGRGAVYAASYAFDGGLLSANLLKLDAATGAVRWSVPCNRTDATPLALDDGRIVLPAGVPGYGSAPDVQMFRDHGDDAELVWDTAGLLAVGGRSQQAVALPRGRVMVGAIPAAVNSTGACTDLYVLDLAYPPGQTGFISQHFAGAGSSPAAEGGAVYTVGAGGMYAFGPVTMAWDVDGDGAIGVGDLLAWEGGWGARDVDGNGAVNSADRAALLSRLRVNERVGLLEGRR